MHAGCPFLECKFSGNYLFMKIFSVKNYCLYVNYLIRHVEAVFKAEEILQNIRLLHTDVSQHSRCAAHRKWQTYYKQRH